MIRRVIFAGTPDFAAMALQAIVAAGFEVPLVLPQPDRPKGRGMQLQPSPVKQAAADLGLPVAQPATLRDEAVQAMLRAQEADVMVVAAYGLLLPPAVLEIPRYGCLNIHASLLPRWRGAAPIQRAIEAGDEETGVCIMQMDAGLDTGAVLSRHVYPIGAQDTAQTVHDALAQIGAQAIVADLQQYEQRVPQAQPEAGIVYAQKLSKAEAEINWQLAAVVLARKIRAFNPVPGAWLDYGGRPMKVWSAALAEGSGVAGTVLRADAEGIVVACGEGALRLENLQPSGGKRMSAAAFAAGHLLQTGQPFGAGA